MGTSESKDTSSRTLLDGARLKLRDLTKLLLLLVEKILDEFDNIK